MDGANAFAFDLLREATRELPSDSNAFLSPLSASMALGMTLNGANGQTYDDMRAALRLSDLSEAEINAGYRDLIGLLGGLDSQDGDADRQLDVGPGWIFRWSRRSPNAGRTYFDAEVTTLDFGSAGRRADHQHLGERQDQRQDPHAARRHRAATRCCS